MHYWQFNIISVGIGKHIFEIYFISIRKIYQGNPIIEPKAVPTLRMGRITLSLVFYIICKGIFFTLCLYNCDCFVINKKADNRFPYFPA